MSVDSLHHHPTTTTNFQLVCCCVLIIFAKTITNIQLLSIVTSQGLRLRPYLCRIWTLESGDGGGVVSHGGCCFRGDSVDSGVPGSKESISEM